MLCTFNTEKPVFRADAKRIVEMAAMRLKNPHTALVAELLGVGASYAAQKGFHTRLAILRDLHRHLQVETYRRAIGSWIFDPNRLIDLQTAIREELKSFEALLETCEPMDRIFAAGYLPMIKAAVSKPD